MREPGLLFLGSSSSVCTETANQALNTCISPDLRDVGLVLGAMGVNAMNTSTQRICPGAQWHVEPHVPAAGAPLILCSSGHLLGSKHRHVPEEDTGPAVALGQQVVGLTVPCPTMCGGRQLKPHSGASSNHTGPSALRTLGKHGQLCRALPLFLPARMHICSR